MFRKAGLQTTITALSRAKLTGIAEKHKRCSANSAGSVVIRTATL
jgi:hypothetical protein